ncbi:MAG: hypothetical protein ACI4NM_03835 [Bullifex sp.]
MKGITFGEYHTWRDFGLVIQSREITAPKAKTHYVNIEGADGSLDFSESFGDVRFERRTLKYTVVSIVPRSEFWTRFTEIQNALHGREFSITDDEDPDYYYIGRVTIDKWKIDKVVGSFTISVEAEPYKYHQAETQVINQVSGTMTLVYKNDRMSVNPTIRVSAPMTIRFGSKTISIDSSSVGTDLFSTDIIFREGNNTLVVTGEGTITVKYQEGAL